MLCLRNVRLVFVAYRSICVSELVVQIVWASVSGLWCAERHMFDPPPSWAIRYLLSVGVGLPSTPVQRYEFLFYVLVPRKRLFMESDRIRQERLALFFLTNYKIKIDAYFSTYHRHRSGFVIITQVHFWIIKKHSSRQARWRHIWSDTRHALIGWYDLIIFPGSHKYFTVYLCLNDQH